MKYAYLRVSTKDQNLDRQVEAVRAYAPELEVGNIYADKQSGKNFDRENYNRLKEVVKSGDELIIKELDRLGRNKQGIKDELSWFKSAGVIVRVLDVPTTLIDFKGQDWIAEMVNNILIEVMGSIAEQERKKINQRQKEGIACAKEKGIRFGRPEKTVECVLLDGETVTEACTRLGVSRSYWYSRRSA